MRGAPKKDVSDRWTPVWHAFFYAMIAVANVLSALNAGRVSPSVAGLSAALAGWHWLMLVRPGAGHRERPRQVALYLPPAFVASGVLVAIDPVFLMVAMTLYNQVFAFMAIRLAVPFAVVLTVTIALAVTRGGDAAGLVVVVICSMAALLFALYLNASSDESRKRRELIEELERTRAELAFAERLAGMTEERRRIARELHDTVTQQLVGIVMHLEAAREGDAEEIQDALERTLGLAREGLAEARRMVWAERPAQLERASLTTALLAATERVSNETGLRIDNAFGDELDALPAPVQALVLRGVQEALANVRKHARARRVAVTVAAESDLVTVDVQDDGAGFDATAAGRRATGGSGFGLRGLRERVEELGGALSIESARGEGTTLAMHVPLPAERA
jgi:signal transduction histidine kinase